MFCFTNFAELTDTNFKFEILIEEELENNVIIDTDEIGVPNEKYESNLDPKLRFDTFICSSKHKYIVGFQYFVFSKITVNYNSYQHCFIIARA